MIIKITKDIALWHKVKSTSVFSIISINIPKWLFVDHLLNLYLNYNITRLVVKAHSGGTSGYVYITDHVKFTEQTEL